MKLSVSRVYVCVLVAMSGIAALPAAASAQYRPGFSEAAIGEDYHIEAGYSWWDAEPSLIVNSESLGILGDDVNLVQDLGIQRHRLAKFDVVLRPARKHRFRFQRLPIIYEADAHQVTREFVFNGQRYTIGLPVTTRVDFTTYRFGYEYDFLYRSRGFLGAFVDVKYTNVDVNLTSPIGEEFVSAVAPIPTVGVVGRAYPHKNLAVTGELAFFRMPENLKETLEGEGSYTDIDINATYNFSKNVGAQMGWRRTNVFYNVDQDAGELRFSGLYFGGVVRY
jgi:hypothetical protein